MIVQHIRPQYTDLHNWCQDRQNVYIGRRGVVFINGARYPLENSMWHNPFKITNTCTREECIEKYKQYIILKIERDNLQEELLQLKGKTLGCWCSPEPCHEDVLIELIKNYSEENI